MRNKKVRWLTETAVLLALLLCLQSVTSSISSIIMVPDLMLYSFIKQLLTGPFVNCVLAIAVIMCGYGSGITIALVSPVFAAALGIAPQYIVVPAIMAGNVAFVVLIKLLMKDHKGVGVRNLFSVVAASAAKTGVLYLLVVQLVCNLLADQLMGQMLFDKPLLAPKMLLDHALPFMFSWPQLITALIGGVLALLITPVLRKALKR